MPVGATLVLGFALLVVVLLDDVGADGVSSVVTGVVSGAATRFTVVVSGTVIGSVIGSVSAPT